LGVDRGAKAAENVGPGLFFDEDDTAVGFLDFNGEVGGLGVKENGIGIFG
jgi:hypothetical protein